MLTAGTALGPYRVLAPLGTGGMGEVYRARDTRLGRDVAVKVITAELSGSDDSIRRFELEARAAGALNHPNVCTVLDVGTYDQSPFVVMELLEGESLRSRLKAGPIPPRKAVDWVAQAALGLAAAHAKGIIHRDIKPENLFLTREGRVKVLDFGLAKLTRSGSPVPPGDDAATLRPTQPGVLLGTIGYMSPEQVRGEPTDQRTDLFTLGAVLYELLTGTRAFAGTTVVETSYRILSDDPPLADASGRRMPPGLQAIVRRCLEKNREERFQSAGDLAFALDTLTGAAGADGGATTVGESARGSRRGPARLLATAVALTALAAFAAHELWPPPQAPVSYQRLTFRRGTVGCARFAPDGQTIVHDASWDGRPSEIFTLRVGHPESRPLGIAEARLFDVSVKGELAIRLRQPGSYALSRGRLARVALGGGEPRALRDDVLEADWTPDGSELAIVVADSGADRLQLPSGTTIARSPDGIGSPRVAAGGREVAFAHGDLLAVAGPGADERTLGSVPGALAGMAWHPRTGELWYAERDTNGSTWLRTISRHGDRRPVHHLPGAAGLLDIAADGRVLLAMHTARSVVMVRVASETRERDLSWLDFSVGSCLSPDGRLLVFDELGAGGGPSGGVYLRPTDGSPAVRLGDGHNGALSPDQQWVAVHVPGSSPRLRVIPVGAGEPRDVDTGDVEPAGAQWYFPDGRHLLFLGRRGGLSPQLFSVPVDGGVPRPVTPPGWVNYARSQVLSPDGRLVASCNFELDTRIYATAGGPPLAVPDLARTEYVTGWTADSRGIYVFQRTELPSCVYRVDLASGHREPCLRLEPEDRTGVGRIWQVIVAPDGRSYAYNFRREQTDLFLVTGLR